MRLRVPPQQLDAIWQSDLMLVGPVDSIDYSTGSLQSLGQVIRFTNLTVTRGVRFLARVRVGSVVEVRGRVSGSRRDSSYITLLQFRGSTLPEPRTCWSAASSHPQAHQSGRCGLASLVVDYTGALYKLDAASITVGSQFLALGIRPLSQGVFVALSGIGGSDTRGIGGSDLSGIGGSDTAGIGGSDLKGIGGSDT